MNELGDEKVEFLNRLKKRRGPKFNCIFLFFGGIGGKRAIAV